MHVAMILTRLHDRVLPGAFAPAHAPGTPHARLRRAATAYQAAIDELASHAGLAA